MEMQKRVQSILFENIFLPVAFAVLSCTTIGLIFYEAASANYWLLHTDEVIRDILTLQKRVIDAQDGARGFLLTSDKTFLTPFASANPEVNRLVDEISYQIRDNERQAPRVERIKTLLSEWFKDSERVLQDPIQQVLTELRARIDQQKPAEIRQMLQEMMNDEYELRSKRLEAQKVIHTFALFAFIPLLLIGNGLLAFRGRKSILTISSEYESKLKENQTQFEQLTHENWKSQAESQLFASMLTSDSLEAIAKNVLHFLSGFISGQQQALAGSLSVARGSDPSEFWQVSSFGIGPEAEAKPEFDARRTLLARALDYKKAAVYHDFSRSHWHVSSMLGAHLPSHLMVAPILFQDKCVALLELGFLQNPSTAFLEFLDEVSARLGGLIVNAVNREQLAVVYEEVKDKAEELKAQQEELQVSNEELEHRAQLLRESQTKLEENNAELEEANETLQTQARNLEEQKDRLDHRNQELVNARGILEKQTVDLAKASQHKSQFLANMSHELRTPLNSSMILAQLLMENRESNLTDKQLDQVNHIFRSGQELLVLINDILDLSKVEAGKIELQFEPVAIQQIVEWTKSTFSHLCEKKGLKLTIRQESYVEVIKVDLGRLQQILANLLSNAVKFTEKGEVSLTISSRQEKGGEQILFDVADTGIGIPADKIDIIFEPFRQADGSVERRFGGTGLGLAISRHLAELMDGVIEVDSKPGKGSRFRLSFPAQISLETKSLATADPASESIRVVLPDGTAERRTPTRSEILVVEDDKEFAKILHDHIVQRGFGCIIARTAAEGRKMAFEQKPMAILLDINLPDGSGLTVLEDLRENPSTANIPVHVISVLDEPSKVLKLGATQFLAKPLSLYQIRDLIESLANDNEVKTVLVVEDDPTQIEAIKLSIASDHIIVDECMSGKIAWEKLSSERKFDCVILDLKLPDISGFELLRMMEKEKATRQWPPIIVHTAIDVSPTEERELRIFSNSLILKGANSGSRLLDEVSLFLKGTAAQKKDSNIPINRANRDEFLKEQTLLLVDDDLRNVFSLTAALEAAGGKIIMASNGREAVDILAKNKDISMVLMDIMMPVMDGLEAIRHIREELQLRDLPIIALTAKAMRDDREACMRAGANDYLAKPIEIQKLFSLLRVWTRRVKS